MWSCPRALPDKWKWWWKSFWHFALFLSCLTGSMEPQSTSSVVLPSTYSLHTFALQPLKGVLRVWKWFLTGLRCCYQLDVANHCAMPFSPKVCDVLMGTVSRLIGIVSLPLITKSTQPHHWIFGDNSNVGMYQTLPCKRNSINSQEYLTRLSSLLDQLMLARLCLHQLQ